MRPLPRAVTWAALLLVGCQTAPVPTASLVLVGEISPGTGYVMGYLERKQLPGSLALLPEPPVDGSPEQAADLAETTGVPQEVAKPTKDCFYPSGHAALGWAWALILTEMAPERADALLQRGHAFGQSRMVCGVQMQSDVDNGRGIGAVVVAQLHADPTYLSQAALARDEI